MQQIQTALRDVNCFCLGPVLFQVIIVNSHLPTLTPNQNWQMNWTRFGGIHIHWFNSGWLSAISTAEIFFYPISMFSLVSIKFWKGLKIAHILACLGDPLEKDSKRFLFLCFIHKLCPECVWDTVDLKYTDLFSMETEHDYLLMFQNFLFVFCLLVTYLVVEDKPSCLVLTHDCI